MSAGALYSGYPMGYGNGTSNWPGIPESLDAAVPQWSDGKSVYFFKGSSYWKYDMSVGALNPGYPKNYGTGTGNFEGLPASLDAGVDRCGAFGPVEFGSRC